MWHFGLIMWLCSAYYVARLPRTFVAAGASGSHHVPPCERGQGVDRSNLSIEGAEAMYVLKGEK